LRSNAAGVIGLGKNALRELATGHACHHDIGQQ
jgi:hypothetical protein